MSIDIEKIRQLEIEKRNQINNLYSDYMKSKRSEYKNFEPIRDMWNNIPERKKFLNENSIYMDKGMNWSDVFIDKVNSDVAKEFLKVSQEAEKGYGALFKKGDTLFFLAHGTEKGKVRLGRNYYSTEEALSALNVRDIIKRDKIKDIFTINCYGGLQPSKINIDGVPVRSIHRSFEPIMGTVYDINADSLEEVNVEMSPIAQKKLETSNKQYSIAINTKVGGDYIQQDAKIALMRNNDESVTLVKGTQEVNDKIGQYEVDKFKKAWEEKKRKKTQVNNNINNTPIQNKAKHTQNQTKSIKPTQPIQNSSKSIQNSNIQLEQRLIQKRLDGPNISDRLNTTTQPKMIPKSFQNEKPKINNSKVKTDSITTNKILAEVADDIDVGFASKIAADFSQFRYGKIISKLF